jgi:hypothetical protein
LPCRQSHYCYYYYYYYYYYFSLDYTYEQTHVIFGFLCLAQLNQHDSWFHFPANYIISLFFMAE